MQLDGKKALITGAGSGIGRSLAIEAASRGVRLALSGRRRQALEETLPQLAGSGHLIIAADVTTPSDRKALMAEVQAQWGGLDLLVNNAGIVPVGPLGAATDEDLQAVLETNLLAPMALVREALPLLKKAKGSRVVNIGSVFGDSPYPLFAAYSASKAGLRGFSIALRRELAPLGIGVTYAAPRATRTPAARGLQSLIEPFEMKFDTPETVAKFIWNAVAREAKAIYPA
ncbi:MAG: SDR family NAD(P)-dependent oxidoreductase, partial [Rhodomicrobium sp.]